MSASLDKTVQIAEVGALVELDENVLSHGIGFVSDKYPPLLLKFNRDENGDVTGYEIDAIKPESEHVQKINFVQVGRVLKKKSKILGVSPKLIVL
jgi:hypothetical protein